jgi:hypothetical protein
MIFKRLNMCFVAKFKVPLTVLRGPILDEAHQQINSWIYQVMRMTNTFLNHKIVLNNM